MWISASKLQQMIAEALATERAQRTLVEQQLAAAVRDLDRERQHSASLSAAKDQQIYTMKGTADERQHSIERLARQLEAKDKDLKRAIDRHVAAMQNGWAMFDEWPKDLYAEDEPEPPEAAPDLMKPMPTLVEDAIQQVGHNPRQIVRAVERQHDKEFVELMQVARTEARKEQQQKVVESFATADDEALAEQVVRQERAKRTA